VLWQHVLCIVCEWYTVQNEPGYGCQAWLILNSTQLTQYTRPAATAPTQRNDVNHSVFLNYNFTKDDRMIETCRSVLSVLM